MVRKWEKPKKEKVKPTHIPGGLYLNLIDYAKSIGVTRMTAYNHMRQGAVESVRLGPKTILVRVKKEDVV